MERTRQHRVANKGPVAMAVSQHQPIEVSLVGEAELNRWHALAWKGEHAAERTESLDADRAARKALSQTHQRGWVDTVEGQVEQKRTAREKRLTDAEARRVAIDKLEAEYQAAVKQQQLSVASEKIANRDPRIVALNTALLHQKVIDEREQQELLSARRKDHQLQQQEAFHEGLKRQIARDEIVERERADAARAQAMAAKESCKQQIAEVMTLRRAAKHAEELEGKRLRLLAELDAEEQRLSARERRQQAKTLNYDRVKQRSEQEAMSPRRPVPSGLQPEHRPNDFTDTEYNAASDYEMRKAALLAAIDRERERKRDMHDVRVQLATESLAAIKQSAYADDDNGTSPSAASSARSKATSTQSSPRAKALLERSWNAASSLNDKMLLADVVRVSARKNLQMRQRGDLEEQIAQTARDKSSQKEREDRFKTLLAARSEEWQRDDAEERDRLKAELHRDNYIRALQHRMKEDNERREKALDVATGKSQMAKVAVDDERFRETVMSQLPSHMEPGLIRKVMAVL